MALGENNPELYWLSVKRGIKAQDLNLIEGTLALRACLETQFLIQR